MHVLWISLGVLAFLIVSLLVLSFGCFFLAFLAPPRKKVADDVLDLNQWNIYGPIKEYMATCGQEVWTLPHKELWITSYDGLKLFGRYYEFVPGATVEIMIHGYRGSGMRDLPCGVLRARELGHNVLLIDQRCGGRSEGHVITFGIREHRDCLMWIEKLRQELGQDVRIILTGVSMGAATVLTTAGQKLPENVIGVLADSGFSTPREIIKRVSWKLKVPPFIGYPLVKLGAIIYGHLNPDSNSAMKAMETCQVPILFIHGEADDFVPCDMSRKLYAACPTKKRLFTVPGATHCMSYPKASEEYLQVMREFFYG